MNRNIKYCSFTFLFSIFITLTGCSGDKNSKLKSASNHGDLKEVKQYIKQLKDVVDGDATELLKMAVRFPDALNTERDDIDEDEWHSILKVNRIINSINSIMLRNSFRFIIHLFVIIVLTVITQIGGLAYLLGLWLFGH